MPSCMAFYYSAPVGEQIILAVSDCAAGVVFAAVVASAVADADLPVRSPTAVASASAVVHLPTAVVHLPTAVAVWVKLSKVYRPAKHIIGHIEDGFYGSNDQPTVS